MTDARIPERWLSNSRLARLSDAHYRAFITALVWAVANRTDGVIEPEDLGLIPQFAPNAVKLFVDAGLWTPLGRGWLITEFMETQTSRAQLQHLDQKRVKEREKKARQRAANRATMSADTAVSGDVSGDSRGDVPGDDTGQDRPGQDRPGRGDHRREPAPVAAVNDHRPKWCGNGADPFEEYR